MTDDEAGSVIPTSAQLEARVLELVDTVRARSRIEDDLVECKREWPSIDKARQLAGSANSAHGDPLLWIIGLDESTGEVVPVGAQDPAQWWSQMQARFDQDIAPTLTKHLGVPVGRGEAVTALLFGTDRAPYLVKAQSGGSPEREVPIRDGTRTRSAHRDELLRILVPALAVPDAVILSANMRAGWHSALDPEPGRRLGREERISMDGDVSVYIEHVRTDVLVLPAHEMSASLNFGEHEIPLAVSGYAAPDIPTRRWGVYIENGDLICTAPGRVTLRLHGDPGLEHYSLLSNSLEGTLSIALGVAGALRPVRISVNVLPQAKGAEIGGGASKTLGHWAR